VDLSTEGQFYSEFMGISEHYGPEDRLCIEQSVERLQACATSAEKPGMLLSKIQSGKTKTFLGIIALAFDNHFDIAVILTKGNKALTKQTLERVRREFALFRERDAIQVHDIMTVPGTLTGYELSQKLVFVAKKQTDNLDRLAILLRETYPELSKKRALIVDDEADYASVGFRNSQSTGLDANVTTHQIDRLRKLFTSSAFLQVTATPYALYLQPDGMTVKDIEFMPIRPAFTQLVPVASQYIGSDFYFTESRNKDSVASYLFHPVGTQELTVLKESDRRRFKVEDCLTSPAIPALRAALCNFIVGGVIRRLQDTHARRPPKKFSFLVHTEAGKAAHSWQEDIVTTLKDKLASAVKGAPKLLEQLVCDAYDELAASIRLEEHDLPAKEEVLSATFQALADDWLMITKVNSERQVEELLDDGGQLRLRTPLNLFIGGQILDRGITVANLIGFFYGRRPNVYQQDTVLQHSRMFGFRPLQDLTVTRLYTAQQIFDAMRRMHEIDTALWDSVQKNPEAPVVFIRRDEAGRVLPCSPNKILLSSTTTLRPFKRLLPVGFQTDYPTRIRAIVRRIDAQLDDLSDGNGLETPFRVPLTVAIELFQEIEPTLEMDHDGGYEFDWTGSRAALEYLSYAASDSADRGQVLILVRKDRNISRFIDGGTRRAYSDAPDTAQREGVIVRRHAIDIPMLMLFRQNGDKAQGWRGSPFYWPVIFAPGSTRTAVYAKTTTPN